MPTDLISDASSDAASVLIAHLRQNPRDALREPEELAAEIGIDPQFVRNVIKSARLPDHEHEDPFQIRISLRPLILWSQRSVHRFDRLVARPLRFILFTLLLTTLFCVGLQAFAEATGLSANGGGFQVSIGSATLVILATGVVHMGCYFRHARSRYALYGALAVWGVVGATAAIGAWQGSVGDSASDRMMAVAITLIGVTMFAILYGALGALASVVGGWLRFWRLDLREERMSRQDLLERYFELQNRLREGKEARRGAKAWEESRFVRAIQSRPYLWAFVGGVAMSLMLVLITGPSHIHPDRLVPQKHLFVFLATSVIGALTWVAYVVAGFLAGNVRKSVLASICFSAGTVLPALLPVGPYGLSYYAHADTLVSVFGNTTLMAFVAAVAGMGAEVQARAAREASLQRNDPAAVAAELLRIHWRLADGATTICVMVVDAARSSEMKSDADPLAVEYSFREYQEWIELHSAERGGRIHSTAGDGAVVAFATSVDALAVARRLQTDISRFNREVNRLRLPFRLRIGLHRGHVAGDLEEVEFTEVIDIAAHVQGAAPVAGIAASDRVVADLNGEDFVPLAKEVDGHKVYLALNPVED